MRMSLDIVNTANNRLETKKLARTKRDLACRQLYMSMPWWHTWQRLIPVIHMYASKQVLPPVTTRTTRPLDTRVYTVVACRWGSQSHIGVPRCNWGRVRYVSAAHPVRSANGRLSSRSDASMAAMVVRTQLRVALVREMRGDGGRADGRNAVGRFYF